MSYARFGWEGSDVYIIGTQDGPEGQRHIECCGCILTANFRKPRTEQEKADVAGIEGGEDIEWDYGPLQEFDTIEGILEHLAEHKRAGHCIPPSCVERLRDDDWVPRI